jgi:hypothetical protein
MALCLLTLGTTSWAQGAPKKFSLILSAGYGTKTGGDVPKVMDGMNAAIRDLAALAGFTVAETLEPAKWGPGLEAELLFRPARNFGLSFGSGLLRKREDTRLAAKRETLTGISVDWTATYQLIPLMLSGYYFLESGSKMTVYAKAGIGYYFGRMTYTTRDEQPLLGIAAWGQNDGEATASGLGFHGGLGLEYPLSPTFAILIEAAGRYVNLKGWSVENDQSGPWGTEHQTGRFWYAEELVEGMGKQYASLQLFEERPSNPALRNIREAAFGFSGFTLKAGLAISF